jgi:hypothetical protein
MPRWFPVNCHKDPGKNNLDQNDLNFTSFRQMDKSEQRFIVKFFFLKCLGAKAIHRELTAVLDSTAYSLSQATGWRGRLATDKLSRQDEFRRGSPPHVLGKALTAFLEEFPFGSAAVTAKQFSQSKSIVKEILRQELGLQRFSGKWVPHSLSDRQKADRRRMAIDLLSVLRRQRPLSFSRIVTENESLFPYYINLITCLQGGEMK